jgi:hypothetical protein
MLPPYHERHELLALVSAGFDPPTCPLPWSHEYIAFGEPVPAWQFVQFAAVPLAR